MYTVLGSGSLWVFLFCIYVGCPCLSSLDSPCCYWFGFTFGLFLDRFGSGSSSSCLFPSAVPPVLGSVFCSSLPYSITFTLCLLYIPVHVCGSVRCCGLRHYMTCGHTFYGRRIIPFVVVGFSDRVRTVTGSGGLVLHSFRHCIHLYVVGWLAIRDVTLMTIVVVRCLFAFAGLRDVWDITLAAFALLDAAATCLRCLWFCWFCPFSGFPS